MKNAEEKLQKKDKRNRIKPQGQRLVWLGVEKRRLEEIEEKRVAKIAREAELNAKRVAEEEERIRNYRSPLQRVLYILGVCFPTKSGETAVEPATEKSEDELLDELEQQMHAQEEDRDGMKKALKKAKKDKEKKKNLDAQHDEHAADLASQKDPEPKTMLERLTDFMEKMFKKAKELDSTAITGESKLEKKKRLKAKADLKKMQEGANDDKIVEAVLKTRERLKAAGELYKAFMDWCRGYSIEEREEFYIGDLMSAAMAGNFNRCIDILEHPFSPIGPNEIDPGEYITPTYAAVVANMNLENRPKQKMNVDVDALFETPLSKLLKSCRKKLQSGKIDFVVKVLLYKGGDIDFVKTAKDEDGKAVLHLAAMNGLDESVQWILNKGANINIKTGQKSRTPLMLAAENDRISTVLLLLKNGAILSINQQDADGRTALHFAALRSSLEMAQVLMICGCSNNIRTKKDRQPSDEATAAGRTDMYEQISFFPGVKDEHIKKLEYLNEYYKAEERSVDGMAMTRSRGGRGGEVMDDNDPFALTN